MAEQASVISKALPIAIGRYYSQEGCRCTRKLGFIVCSPLRYDGTVPSERGPNTLGRSAPYLQ